MENILKNSDNSSKFVAICVVEGIVLYIEVWMPKDSICFIIQNAYILSRLFDISGYIY
mgnify:CR=1 FL=1